MAETTVKAYKRTGFNAINVPKNFSVLENAADEVRFLPSLDLCQRFFLNSIRVKVTSESDVAGIDYITIGDSSGSVANQDPACYSVHGYSMVAADVAELRLVQDSWMNLYGYDGIEAVLDGFVTRSSIGEYGIGEVGGYIRDDMLVPEYPLLMIAGGTGGQLDRGRILSNESVSAAIVMSTADLSGMNNIITGPNGYNGVVYFTGPTDSSGNYKAYKAIIDTATTANVPFTVITLSKGAYDIFPNLANHNLEGAGLYDYIKVRKAIDVLRSFGLDNAITASYQVPSHYIEATIDEYGHISALKGKSGTYRLSEYTTAYNVDYTYSQEYEDASPVEVYHPKYVRTLLGEWNKYILASIASGNSRIIEPQDLPTDIDGGSFLNVAPVIWYTADPQPNGCPYFNIRTKDNVNIYENGVKGMEWRNNPIRYVETSGNAVKMLQFENEQTWKDTLSSEEFLETFGEGTNALSYLGSSIGKTIKTGLYKMFEGTWGLPGGELAASLVFGRTKSQQAELDRAFEARREREQFEISNMVDVPEVQFAPSFTLRDSVGNGAFITRMCLDPRDMKKFDRIQKQFGMKRAEPLTKAMLNPGNSGFAYVEAKGASIQAKEGIKNANQDIINDVGNMLSGGIRIWAERPDVTQYTP